jgi:Ca2+-binding RTX toxin-like protein
VNLDDAGDRADRTIDLADEGSGYGYRVTGLLAPGAPDRGRIWLLDPTENVTIKTGSGNDVFRVHDFKEAPALTLDAGAGNNTLDYSAYTGDVQVNLPLGSATGLAQISGFENVTGGQGNNLIVGDANAQKLIAGTGRNVLIGGGGNVTLDASRSTGDNLLVGGTTQFDRQKDALDAIFAEWTRPDLGFDDRISDLQFGFNNAGAKPDNAVGNTPILLNQATVADGSGSDTMTGGAGQNWYVLGLEDDQDVTNFATGRDRTTSVA